MYSGSAATTILCATPVRNGQLARATRCQWMLLGRSALPGLRSTPLCAGRRRGHRWHASRGDGGRALWTGWWTGVQLWEGPSSASFLDPLLFCSGAASMASPWCRTACPGAGLSSVLTWRKASVLNWMWSRWWSGDSSTWRSSCLGIRVWDRSCLPLLLRTTAPVEEGFTGAESTVAPRDKCLASCSRSLLRCSRERILSLPGVAPAGGVDLCMPPVVLSRATPLEMILKLS
mmetsp:Transcript_36136/g.76704  ORF Transcript_36136/g.76704 Transcript_36136/m.76704 type:complete len:232 (+) Transcript_36136:137-832(+)